MGPLSYRGRREQTWQNGCLCRPRQHWMARSLCEGAYPSCSRALAHLATLSMRDSSNTGLQEVKCGRMRVSWPMTSPGYLCGWVSDGHECLCGADGCKDWGQLRVSRQCMIGRSGLGMW